MANTFLDKPVHQHRDVSAESEELILVDTEDNVIGHRSKAACHDELGILHRAFSLFLFNDKGALLLQRRSARKRLWPRYWSNSCCSHPRRGESLTVATARRLQDELNIAAPLLEHVYHFRYRATFDGKGSENELCHVYLGRVSGEIRPNTREIEAHRFVSINEMAQELADRPECFTPWFKQEWRRLNEEFGERLGRYAI